VFQYHLSLTKDSGILHVFLSQSEASEVRARGLEAFLVSTKKHLLWSLCWRYDLVLRTAAFLLLQLEFLLHCCLCVWCVVVCVVCVCVVCVICVCGVCGVCVHVCVLCVNVVCVHMDE